MAVFPEAYYRIFDALENNQVDYLLVGGYLLNIHGYKRQTKFLDLWLRPTDANKDQLIYALESLNIDVEPLEKLSFEEFEAFEFGLSPFITQIMTKVSGLRFDAAWSHRDLIDTDGFEIPALSLDDLKTNLQSAGRTRDLDALKHLP